MKNKKATIAAVDNSETAKKDHALIEAIFDSIPGYLYVYDESGKLIKWNKQHEAMTGYTSEELSHMTLEKWFDRDDLSKVNAAVQDVFEKGYGEVEAQLILKSGEKMITRSSGVPLILDGQRYFAGIGIDISRSKKAEEQLQQTMKDLLESQRIAHVGTWRLNLASNEVVWSEELYRMYGFDPTIPPPPYTEHMKLFTPESWDKLSTALEHTRISGIPYELELEMLTSDQSNRWMWTRGEVEKDSNGNIIFMSGVAQDITEHKRVEREIQQSEERFQLLFNKAPLGYQSLDSDGCFIDVNQKWLDTLGYSKEEVIGKWFGDFLCPEYVEGFRQRFPIFKAQGVIHSEFEMLCKDRQRLFLSFEGKVGYDSEGSFKQTHCIIQDITAQRKAEKALLESEERYKNLFEYSGAGVGYYTTDGVVISYNKRALENFGGNLEDYIGKSIRVLFPKEMADMLLTRIEQAILSDQPQEYEDFMDLSGKSKWFASTFSRVLNSSGEVAGVQIISLDITEKKEVAISIRRQNELFASLLKLLPVGVFMVDAQDGKPLLANDTAKTLLGRGILPDVNEHNLSEIYKAYKNGTMEHYPTREMPIVLGMQGVRAHIDDMIVEHPDGTKVLLEVFGTPVKDDKEKVWASLVTFMDITERKKAENQLIHLSYHDHLTDLYNRRFFEQELKRLDTKENLPLSIIMTDVNGLKLVNDSFGHNFGDRLLIETAKVLNMVCRKGDIVSRIGGDEFVVLLPKTNEEEAALIANDIKTLASTVEIANIQLSISYGYDTKTNHNKTIVETLANAENHMYQHKLYERSSIRSKTIDLIMNTLYEKSNREAEHSNRVSAICGSIALKMNFDRDAVNQIKIAGLIHDIGKIGIEEKILNKTGKLSLAEREQIMKHPGIGWRILSSANEFSALAEFILDHHERWDGLGYPTGIKGEAIKLEARIISVADAYDAMTSERSYQKARSKEDAIIELKRCSGTQWDPYVVDVFVNQVLPDERNFSREGEPLFSVFEKEKKPGGRP